MIVSTALVLALSAAPLASSSSATTAHVLVQEAPSRSDIGDAIDRSVRWVRRQQDPTTGAYGDFTTTTFTLLGFARSPRKYVTSDGPFVTKAIDYLLSFQREDGAFADDGWNDEAIRYGTVFAALVLSSYEGYDGQLARANAFLGEAGASKADGPGWKPSPSLPTEDADKALAARTAAGERLAGQGPDGAFGEGAGRLEATVSAVLELSDIHAYLGTLSASSGAPREVQALPALSPADAARARKAFVRGADYLVEHMIEPGKWGFGDRADPGITAMVTDALLSAPGERSENVQRAIDAALAYLVSLQKEDGSIHDGQIANYVTSAAVMALSKANRPGDAEVIARARTFLETLQADEGEGYSSEDRFYGGVGYGDDERPDLSNTQMALEALHAAGLEDGSDTYEKAIEFLQRCQNRSESNDLAIPSDGGTIKGGNDGGAGYAPGDSKAGFVELRDGTKVPRSYGSMTYALLKSYLFAGLPKDDPRVEAAWSWLTKNYTLDVNPGFEASPDPAAAYQGLFYYFSTMSKTLDLYGSETVVDAAGNEHMWRAELAGRLLSMQRQDGSWINTNAPRWYEGNPVLATAYALITLGTTIDG